MADWVFLSPLRIEAEQMWVREISFEDLINDFTVKIAVENFSNVG